MTGVQQRRQQRQGLGLVRVQACAQVRRRLHQRLGPPPGPHLRVDAAEQVVGQPDATDREQLVDLGEHAFQAHRPRLALDQRQQRRTAILAGGSALRVVVLVLAVADGDEGADALHRACRYPGGHPGEQGLLGPVQRRGDHATRARSGRRLDPLLSAALQQRRPDLLRAALRLSDLRGQPVGELVGVLDTALAKAQRPADLRPVPFDRPAGPVIEPQLSGRDLDLACDELHGLVGELVAPGREPPRQREVLEQQRQPEPRRTRLIAQQRHLVGQQREVLDQLIELQPTCQCVLRATNQQERASYR